MKTKESEGSIPHHADFATAFNVGCQAAPQSITYAAVQVRSPEHVQTELILTFVHSFTSHSRRFPVAWAFDRFDYKTFCWFIIVYVEGGSTDAEELLNWWNE
jgi:hypothetical protein